MNLSNLMPGESRKKISRLLCVTALSTCSVFAYAQQQQVKLTGSNLPLKSVFKQIEKQTDLSIDYRSQDVDDSRIVKQMPKATTVQQAMNQLLAGTDCVVTFSNGHIIIKKQASNTTNQQSKLVKGTIVDATGMPVIGANVMVKGTTNGTITDMDGNFSLEADNNAILVVSYIGFANQEIKVGNQTNLAIIMKEDAEALDELVVVGYGTQKRSNLTGSVEVVSSKELANRPVASPSALLQGRVSGMTFSMPSNGNAPGSNPTLQIRGQASLSGETPPLVVIDGIPSDMNDFNSMNPNDIESVSVLKDAASSAVYGARAPYGVLMVTTKMGKRGEKTQVTYSGNWGIQKPIRMPYSADAYTFGVIKNQALENSRRTPLYTEDELDLIRDNILNPGKYSKEELVPTDGNSWAGYGYENNDIVRTWLRKTSLNQSHNISLKGGNEKSTYFVSLGYQYQPSAFNFVTDFDNYKRFNVNGGVSTQVNKWLKLTYRSRYSYSSAKEPSFDYGIGRSRLYQLIYTTWPTCQITNPDGRNPQRWSLE